jgi:hypothetical protein
MSFPRAKKLDVMDATAYVVELLDIGNRFFEPLYSEEEDQIEEDEYASLYDDCDDELQNWRVA